MSDYPEIKAPHLVGTYPAAVNAGGGLVWDAVLEYRVWIQTALVASEAEEDDYYYVFETYEEALAFSEATDGAEQPIALVLQEEYIAENELGVFVHIKAQRLTEWPVEFLSRPRRNQETLVAFFSPNAPSNRLEILRGQA